MHKKETYVLFFDESGKSKIVDIGNHFLLCGLVINKDLHMALSSYMISLKNKSGISVSKNIHDFDLFENEKINGKRIKISKIDTFFERLLRLVEGSDFECFVLLIDKKPYIKKMEKASRRKNVSLGAIGKYLKRNQAHDFLYEILAKKLFLRFGNFLYAEDSVGEIVAESRRWDDHATLSA
ncbi:hypothetical protein KJ845_00655, partial [Patescibacteria group bacterium]|nr:hypothetical protein [Patescibacteria group bacterium]